MRSSRRRYREIIESDLEIMPLMNLFVALIPMLLISAVFLNVTVIDMQMPGDATDQSAKNLSKEPLLLAVTIKDQHYVVEGRKLRKRVVARGDEGADDKLASVLADIKGSHPKNEEIIIISQPKTRYDDIVAVMDISREAGMPLASLLGSN